VSEKTLVWLVWEGVDYEGAIAKSVHASKDGALAAASAIMRKYADVQWHSDADNDSEHLIFERKSHASFGAPDYISIDAFEVLS
jgi:hypothetical protein